jgi:hypothetical protein
MPRPPAVRPFHNLQKPCSSTSSHETTPLHADTTMASQPKGGYTAEEQQLMQISKRKPPANIAGLLKFMDDGANHFNKEEQLLISQSESGRRLATAISKCRGVRGEMVQARKELSASDGSDQTLRIRHQMQKMKYSECLSYHTCPERWKEYSQCWSNLSRIPLEELKEINEQGALPLLCQSERQSLERCVGNHVSGAARAGAAGSDDIMNDWNGMPENDDDSYSF